MAGGKKRLSKLFYCRVNIYLLCIIYLGQIDRHTDRWTHRQTDRQTDRCIYQHVDKQSDVLVQRNILIHTDVKCADSFAGI